MADKYKYTFNLPFDQEEIAPEPTGVMGKTAAPKPQEKSWDQQLADMLGAYWGSPEEAKKRTSPTPPADYTDEELSIYEKYADVSPPYAEGMIGGLRDMQAYRERWGITTSLTDKPKWLTEQGSDVRVPEEPTIQTQELPDTDPETGQPILSGADVVAKEVARKMPQETADTGNGLMSSPRSEVKTPAKGNTAFLEAYLDKVLVSEGLYQDDIEDTGNVIKKDGTILGTMRGITPKVYAKWINKSVNDLTVDDMKSISEDTARDIYREEYWKKPKLDRLPENLQESVFDMYINAGGGAIKALQRAAGMPDDQVDGSLGPVTLAAVKKANISVDDYADARIEYYKDVVKRNPEKKKYLNGWVSRANKYRE